MELLKKCVEIVKNPYLYRTSIEIPYDVGSKRIIAKYRRSEKLASYLKNTEVR